VTNAAKKGSRYLATELSPLLVDEQKRLPQVIGASYPVVPYLFRNGLVMVIVMVSLTTTRWSANLMVGECEGIGIEPMPKDPPTKLIQPLPFDSHDKSYKTKRLPFDTVSHLN
jgi:hypothetical protein